MKKMLTAIALLCVAAGALAGGAEAAAATPENVVLIRDATILTVSHGKIEHGSLLIRGSKIAAVGPNDQVTAPAGATVIDAAGKFLFPGIIDTHSHTAIEGSVNEISLPNTGMVRIRDVINDEDVSVYRELAGGTTAALQLHGSANSIGGQSQISKWRWGHPASDYPISDAPRTIKFALGENPKSSNFRPPPGIPPQYPQTRMGVEEVIRQSFTDARDYQAKWDDYNARKARGESPIPPRRDLLMEVMNDILKGTVDIHSHCYRSDEILMLLNLGDELGFKVRMLQHVLEGYKVAKEIAAHGTGAGTFNDWWGFKIEANDATPYNETLMARAGVVVSTNSDSDELARRLNLDAAKAVKYGGLSEEEALKLCTLNAAKQLRLDHRMGSLDVGKDADVVIWTGHPFSTYSRVEMTFVDGEIVFDRERDLAGRAALAKEKADRLKKEADEEAKNKKSDTKKPEETNE
jgi:imidazolonepropionase-like amidohydrolase